MISSCNFSIKGNTDTCENCRPISLLCVGYKLFAALLKNRLIDGGAERRLSTTQFGFRSKCGTMDAVFILRRRSETALAQRSGKLLILALDWQKAFDSIDPSAMVAGLRRFGVPFHAGSFRSRTVARHRGHENSIQEFHRAVLYRPFYLVWS